MKYRLGSPEFYAALDSRTARFKLPLWGRLARANLPELGRGAASRPYTAMSPGFDGRPSMVLGYGPSFHAHMDRVEALREQGFRIVATDRTLPHLWGMGLLPDVVVALDSSRQLRAFLEGTPRLYLEALEAAGRVRRAGEDYEVAAPVPVDGSLRAGLSGSLPLEETGESRRIMSFLKGGRRAPLGRIAARMGFSAHPVPTERVQAIFSITIDPVARQMFKGPMGWFVPWSTSRLTRALERLTGIKPVPTAGNVGTTAMNLAVILGARPVALLGLDFSPGFEPGGGKDTRVSGASYGAVNLAAYAVATRRHLTHPELRAVYARAGVLNASEGILHGPFIERTGIDALLNIHQEESWQGEAASRNPDPSESEGRAAAFARAAVNMAALDGHRR